MDRLGRTVAGCGLALLASLGCRATRDEVPPGKPYRPDGGQGAPVGFGSQPQTPASINAGMGGYQMPNAGGPNNAFGPAPGGDVTGTIPSRTFGPPGSSGSADSPGAGMSGLGGAPPLGAAGGSMGSTGAGQYPAQGDGSFLSPPQTRGVMGAKDQIPSPN